MRIRHMKVAAALAVGAVVLAACGDGDGGDGTGSATTGETIAASPAAGSAAVGTATTSLGEVLVDSDGLTLYGFTDDVDGESTCYDACAEAWPPVEGDAALDPSLDAALFTAVERIDGTTQLKVGDRPLYTFAGDSAPGDVNGQESGGVWFAASPAGELIGFDVEAGQASAGESTTTSEPAEQPASESELGPVLSDADGKTLYVFTNDRANQSVCNDPCSTTWPPVPGDAPNPSGPDQTRLGVIQRDDGSSQMALDGQPLYSYVDDENPGDTNGQGIGGVWFAVDAEGTVLIPPAARIGSTDIGDVLIGDDGFTLYVFANDEPGKSNCSDPCSATWPPVPADTPIDPTLDPAQFGSITRDDGTQQLTVADRPLYRYVEDVNPGDANGVLVGDGVWSGVAASDLVVLDEPAAPGGGYAAPAPQATISTGETDLGHVLVDGDGHTLYGFTNDTDGQSSCNDSCAEAWPPVPGDTAVDPELAAGADFHAITRDDGSEQLAVGQWPLYRFGGDAAPGQTNGQGSGGVWFAVAPDGTLIE